MITEEEHHKSLLIPATKFIITDKAATNEYYINVCSRNYKINSVRFIKFVKSFYSQDQWKEKLQGYKLPLARKTTKSKAGIMSDFIGAFLMNYIVLLFDELQKGNIVEIGGTFPFMRLSFEKTFSYQRINGDLIKLHRFILKVKLINRFNKLRSYSYMGRINKMTHFFQIRKQLKYYDATIIYKSRNNIS